jgi:hypothetical protein
LHVTFGNGTTGDVHLSEFLNSSQVSGTVFERLRDPIVFREAEAVMGAGQWPNCADLAPDAMYDAIEAPGQSVLKP